MKSEQFPMSEVSPDDTKMELTCGCAKMALLLLEDLHGEAAVKRVVAKTRMNLDYLRDASNWMSLVYYYRFLDELVEFTGNPNAPFEAGTYAVRRECFAPIAALIARLGTVGGTYRLFVGLSNRFTRVENVEISKVTACSCTISFIFLDGHHQDRNNCLAIQGVLAVLPELHGCPRAQISHPQCQCESGDRCTYEIEWVRKPRALPALLGMALGLGLGMLLAITEWGASHIVLTAVMGFSGYLTGQGATGAMRLREMKTNSEKQARSLEASMQATEKLNDDLQGQVEERTEALRVANDNLKQAYDDLQESQERELAHQREATIGILASGMAHELNTPLNTIQMALQGLQQHQAGSRERRELQDNAWKAALRCSRVVRELLAFSREPQTVSLMRLHEVTESALSLFESEMPEGISIFREFDDPPPVAHVDGAQIQQSLLNLLNNAADALNTQGTVTVRLRTDNGHAVVEVADNGPGIPVDLQKRIFEPFESTKRNTGLGLGLGLSITSELVRKNGGRINVVSQPGEGACFTLRFPLVASGHESDVIGGRRAMEALAVAGAPVPAESLPSEAPPDTEQPAADLPDNAIHVLLIEDDPGAGLTLKRMLEWHDIRVVHEASGKQGIEAFDPCRFDAVVTDVLLGDITGVDVLRFIREKDKHFPVILLTGHDSIGSAIEALRLGAQDYIQKPLERIEDLINPVRTAVRHHKLQLESQQLTENLRASETRFRSLAELLPETVFEADREGRVTFLNESGMARFGLTKEILQDGFYLPQGVAPEDAERVQATLGRTLNGETVSGIEFTGKHQSGETFPILAFSTPIRSDGAVTGVRSIVIDITQQKEAEKKLLHFQEMLREMDSELQLTEEQERSKLAADLHDSVAQLLVAAKMRINVVGRKMNDPNLTSHLEASSEILTDAIQQTRSLVFQLSPPCLYSQGLQAALHELAGHMQPLHGLRVAFTPSEHPLRLEEKANIHLFRAVRELLVNVAKHAGVSDCTLTLTHREDRVCATVEDKGSGFTVSSTPSGAPRGGFGLFGMRERLRTVEGDLVLESAPGQGTKVTLSVPETLPGSPND